MIVASMPNSGSVQPPREGEVCVGPKEILSGSPRKKNKEGGFWRVRKSWGDEIGQVQSNPYNIKIQSNWMELARGESRVRGAIGKATKIE